MTMLLIRQGRLQTMSNRDYFSTQNEMYMQVLGHVNLLSRHSDTEYKVTAVEVHSYRNSHCDHFTSSVRSWVEIGHDTTDKYSKAFIDIRLHAGVTTPVAPYGPLWPNVTSSIKPQVHNVSQRHQRRTEPQPQGIC